MNIDTGDIYDSREAAIRAGVSPDRIVEISGPKTAVKKVQKAVKLLTKNQAKRERRKAKRKG